LFVGLIAPETFCLVRNVLEFDTNWATVHLLEVFNGVNNRSTFILK
jgi:hypothetical protein